MQIEATISIIIIMISVLHVMLEQLAPQVANGQCRTSSHYPQCLLQYFSMQSVDFLGRIKVQPLLLPQALVLLLYLLLEGHFFVAFLSIDGSLLRSQGRQLKVEDSIRSGDPYVGSLAPGKRGNLVHISVIVISRIGPAAVQDTILYGGKLIFSWFGGGKKSHLFLGESMKIYGILLIVLNLHSIERLFPYLFGSCIRNSGVGIAIHYNGCP